MQAYRIKMVLATLALSAATSSAIGKDVNAQQFLNDKLAAKAGLSYARALPAIQTCTTKIKHDKCGKGEGGCADNSYEITQCKVDRPAGIEKYIDVAKVSNSRIESVKDLTFDQKNTVSLPDRALLNSVDYQNCDDVSITQVINLSVTGVQSMQVMKTNSLTTTQTGSIQLTGSYFGTGASTSYSFAQAVYSSNQTQEGSSSTVVRSTSTTLAIGPRRSGRFELLAYQTSVELPYSAKVIVDGELVANEAGLTLASQLLTAEERTIPFSGVLRMSDVSSAFLRTVRATKENQCTADGQGLIVQTNTQHSIPAAALPADLKKKYSTPKSFFSKVASKKLAAIPLEAVSTDQVIGPADGVGYETISVSEVSKPAPFCGFNDLGFMNLGIFSVESRRYTQYSNGTVVSSWTSDVETFLRCWP